MRPARLLIPLIAATALSLGSLFAAAPSAGIATGDTPEFAWRAAPTGSMGRSSLADLRGTPVLVEFWGTR